MAIPSNLPSWESICADEVPRSFQVRSPETYIDLFLAHAPEVFEKAQLSKRLIHFINQNNLQAPQLEKVRAVFGSIINISENNAHYHPPVYSDILRSTTIPGGEKLSHACAYAPLETIREIVTQSPELINAQGARALVLATFNNRSDVIQLLLGNGADPAIIIHPSGMNALHLACHAGLLEAVQPLAPKCDPNARATDGRTALMLAAVNRHPAVVQFLLESGADPTITDAHGWTALHFACQGGSLEAVQLLASKIDLNTPTTASRTPLMVAAGNGHPTVVQFLLESGADTAITENGMNALHYACDAGSLEAVQLFAPKIDLNTPTTAGRTPLMIAALRNHPAVVQFLLGNGADPAITDTNGMNALHSFHWYRMNALHYACHAGSLEAVQLLAPKCDLNARGTDGRTALMLAAQANHPAIVEFLLENGADTTIIDFGGMNALHFACYAGSLGAVQLLAPKTDLNIPTTTADRTPLMIAAGQNHPHIIEFLLDVGADREIRHRRTGEIALDMALAQGHTLCAECLEAEGNSNNARTTAAFR